VVSVTGRNQMVNGGGNICPASTMRRAGRMSEAGVPEQRSGHLPVGRERINRQRFSLPQPERQAGWGFSERTNQPEPAGRGKSRAAFPNGPERKTIQPQAGGAPRGLRHWAKSNGQRRRENMPGVDHAARRTYVRSGGFRTTEQGTFRLDGNESTVSGFPFPSRSDKRGGVSQEERINRSQRGAAKSRAAFPNGPERKTIQSQAGGAPRGLRYWAKSNDYRRPEHMPAATVGAPDVCPKRGFPNNGAGHVPLGRERINRQRFSLPQPERQARWGFSGRANQPEPAGRGKKPRGFSERTGAENDSVAGRRCAAWSPLLGEIK
jgi:hypothetical protein